MSKFEPATVAASQINKKKSWRKRSEVNFLFVVIKSSCTNNDVIAKCFPL